MKTVKEVFHEDASLEEVCEIYAERLQYEGFTVASGKDPIKITAHRESLQVPGSPLTIQTHASKPLKAEVDFKEQSDGVAVQLTVWMTDFVILDTGEGRYIDETIDRIVTADLEAEPPPVVPNVSTHAQVAFYGGILVFLAPLFMFFLNASQSLGLLLAMGFEVFICVVLALFALRDVIVKPKEMTGKKRIAAAILLGVLGCLLGAGLLLALHGASLFPD